MKILDYKWSLIIYQFKTLIFRFISLIIKYKVNLIYFTFAFIIGILLIVFSFEFYYYFNEVLLSEDYSILNAGESSSQGSNPHNINSGGGSSNNPNPGSNPGPGPGPDFGYHPSWLDTVMIKDTDRLANYLANHTGKDLQKAGIMFGNYGPNNQPVGYFDKDLSRVARYVRFIHRDWFNRVSLNTQPITDGLIYNIRTLRMDVPRTFS
jgi:hypothetical protein